MLISTETLAQHLNDPEWVAFDCRHDLGDHAAGERIYAESHVPGAYFANVETDLSGPKSGINGRHPLPTPVAFASYLQRCGVRPASTLVAYDDVGGQYAARFWWLCRWIGLSGAVVLDGGWSKWCAEGRSVDAEVPVARAGDVTVRCDDSHWVPVDEVARMSSGGGGVLIDARAPERFRGEVEPIDRMAGHIPGARNRFFKLNLNEDLTMRPPAELRREFEELLRGHGKTPTEVVHQCGSGITACVNVLAMEYAGLAGSKLYPGSWSEWIADDTRPLG